MIDNEVLNRPEVAKACMKHYSLVNERQQVKVKSTPLAPFISDKIKISPGISMMYKFENGQFVKNNA